MTENVEENGDTIHLVMNDDIFFQRCRCVLNIGRLLFW